MNKYLSKIAATLTRICLVVVFFTASPDPAAAANEEENAHRIGGFLGRWIEELGTYVRESSDALGGIGSPGQSREWLERGDGLAAGFLVDTVDTARKVVERAAGATASLAEKLRDSYERVRSWTDQAEYVGFQIDAAIDADPRLLIGNVQDTSFDSDGFDRQAEGVRDILIRPDVQKGFVGVQGDPTGTSAFEQVGGDLDSQADEAITLRQELTEEGGFDQGSDDHYSTNNVPIRPDTEENFASLQDESSESSSFDQDIENNTRDASEIPIRPDADDHFISPEADDVDGSPTSLEDQVQQDVAELRDEYDDFNQLDDRSAIDIDEDESAFYEDETAYYEDEPLTDTMDDKFIAHEAEEAGLSTDDIIYDDPADDPWLDEKEEMYLEEGWTEAELSEAMGEPYDTVDNDQGFQEITNKDFDDDPRWEDITGQGNLPNDLDLAPDPALDPAYARRGGAAVEGVEWAAPDSENAWTEEGSSAGSNPGWNDQLEAFKRKQRDSYDQLEARGEQERQQAELEAQRRAQEQQATVKNSGGAPGQGFDDFLRGLTQGVDTFTQGVNQYARQRALNKPSTDSGDDGGCYYSQLLQRWERGCGGEGQ